MKTPDHPDELPHPGDSTRESAPGTIRSAACSSCDAAIDRRDRFCRACGTPVVSATRDIEERFRPGTLFAGRFRIVSLLGRGRSGDVYRAEDLELGQTVALKFLSGLRFNDRARAQVRTQVSLARQIAHPNVCRVYDMGESQGDVYLSMEYVDGESLTTLLQRIGRPPVEKSLQIGRKLAIGLAAAHAKGVLHRHLEPRNIMIDGRGEVRIMDVGLGVIALDATPSGGHASAYMAPEQLAGHQATAAADIYALGLVLYEVLTGRRTVAVVDAGELRLERELSPTMAPSMFVPELESRIDRIVLRCLEPDPHMRPPSALSVAAALPGGDVLIDAIALGETPSPDVVADSGPVGALRPRVAMTWLACAAIALAIALILTPQTQMVAMLPFGDSPEVLASRARDLLRELGYSDANQESAFGFDRDNAYLQYVRQTMTESGMSRHAEWKRRLSQVPAPISFWYRQSAGRLVPAFTFSTITGLFDPRRASRAERTVAVELGLDGRLLRLMADPASAPRSSLLPDAAPDWSPLFAAARLDLAQWTAVEPRSAPTTIADARAAWTGIYSETSGLPARIEAAASNGRITEFVISFPWTVAPDRTAPVAAGLTAWGAAAFTILVVLTNICVAAVALHNWRRGRGDVRGALLVGLYVSGVLVLLQLMLSPDLIDGLLQRPLLVASFGEGAYVAVIYLALEPWVRRHWPQTLITWSRVLTRRWRDPLVGRDMLLAVVAGLAVLCAGRLSALGIIAAGGPPQGPNSLLEPSGLGFALENLAGGRLIFAGMFAPIFRGLVQAPLFFFVLFLFRTMFRSTWIAITAFVMSCAAFNVLQTMRLETWTAATGVFVFLLYVIVYLPIALRYGIFFLTVLYFIPGYADDAMLTTHLAAWYGQSTLIAVLTISMLALWACRLSIGSASRGAGAVTT